MQVHVVGCQPDAGLPHAHAQHTLLYRTCLHTHAHTHASRQTGQAQARTPQKNTHLEEAVARFSDAAGEVARLIHAGKGVQQGLPAAACHASKHNTA